MKKLNNKDQRGMQTSPALREVGLQALIFGGAVATSTHPGASLLMPTSLRGPKLPIGGGE
jgi:hypothetical protein